MMEPGYEEELDVDVILEALDTLSGRIMYLEEQIADSDEWKEDLIEPLSSERRIYRQRPLLEQQLTEARKVERRYRQLLQNLAP
jgi:hypothetical protein